MRLSVVSSLHASSCRFFNFFAALSLVAGYRLRRSRCLEMHQHEMLAARFYRAPRGFVFS
jgi:uncharacterized membrane protein YozB (DUF420 family)